MFSGMEWGNGTILKRVTRIAEEYRKTGLITETWLAPWWEMRASKSIFFESMQAALQAACNGVP
jgi:hypothetical protein